MHQGRKSVFPIKVCCRPLIRGSGLQMNRQLLRVAFEGGYGGNSAGKCRLPLSSSSSSPIAINNKRDAAIAPARIIPSPPPPRPLLSPRRPAEPPLPGRAGRGARGTEPGARCALRGTRCGPACFVPPRPGAQARRGPG